MSQCVICVESSSLFIKGHVRDLLVILQSFIDGLGKVNGKA